MKRFALCLIVLVMIFSVVPSLGCECGGPGLSVFGGTVSPEEVEPGGEITVTAYVAPPQETELEIHWLGEEFGPFYTDASGEFLGVLDIDPQLSEGEYELEVWAPQLGQGSIISVTVVVPLPPEVPTSIPCDLEIQYSWGACHAEWGRYELTINSNGEADFVKSLGHPDVEGYFSEQSEFNLSDEEMLGIYQEIMKNNFFGLDEEYRDPQIVDGSCSSLRVKAVEREHQVFVQNREIERFDRITASITAILGSKVPDWQDLDWEAFEDAMERAFESMERENG
jgi:hypothetical protein